MFSAMNGTSLAFKIPDEFRNANILIYLIETYSWRFCSIEI